MCNRPFVSRLNRPAIWPGVQQYAHEDAYERTKTPLDSLTKPLIVVLT